MKNYIINEETIAVIPINRKSTKIIEKNRILIENINSMKIIKKSCEYYGNTYIGRREGSKILINIKYKAPIIIEESKNIIFFPLNSPRLEECIWISLKNIISYKKNKNKTSILLINNRHFEVNISYESFNNQYLKATKLDYILNMRKK